MSDTSEPVNDQAARPQYRGPQVEITTATVGGRCVATVRGELDLVTADQLLAAMAALLSHGHRAVFLDLTDMSFCDASGLNALLTAHRAYRAAHGTLVLTGCSPRLTRLLSLTGLDDELCTEQQGTFRLQPDPSPGVE